MILGGNSVSGKNFKEFVSSRNPSSTFIDVKRSDVEGASYSSGRLPDLNEKLFEIVSSYKPTHIINFLGSVSQDFAVGLRANVEIPQALLEAAVKVAPTSSIVLIGSAAEYGQIKNPSRAVRETEPLVPVSVYGTTKAMQSLLVPLYANRFKLNVKLARTFNVLAPGLPPHLFVGRVYEQIENIRTGRQTEIRVGPLTDERDYISAHAASSDYLQILLHGAPGETYNVCSGYPITMGELLEQILSQEGLVDVGVVQDTAIARSPVPRIFGSREKVNALSA